MTRTYFRLLFVEISMAIDEFCESGDKIEFLFKLFAQHQVLFFLSLIMRHWWRR